MHIYQGLDLDIDKGEVISFVGGGGKTTTLFGLAKELKELNKKVLITTTTAIYNPKERDYDYYFLKEMGDFSPKDGSITIFGDRVEDEKLWGVTSWKVEEIMKRKIFHFLLIEADGAKGKPIKGHASYEPVIPESTTKTIGIIGLDALEKKIEDIAYRPEKFAEITNSEYGKIIDEEILVKYILNPEGLFKGGRGTRILLLNKAYNEKTILIGTKIRRSLFAKGYKDTVIVTDIRRKKFY